eukprot:jgi/Psemu1/207853/e_gw1.449.3.1
MNNVRVHPFPSLLDYLIHRRAKSIVPPSHRVFSTVNDKINKPLYPRAAVAVTIQWTCPEKKANHYLLVQRKNPPDQYKWSLPGGKIELGENTLAAAKREVLEETQIRNCRWYSDTFLTTDGIVVGDEKQKEGKNDSKQYDFHYVIAHCFALVSSSDSEETPAVMASDDALNTRWWTLKELHNLDCSANTIKVIQTAEELRRLGFLSV